MIKKVAEKGLVNRPECVYRVYDGQETTNRTAVQAALPGHVQAGQHPLA